MREKRTTIWRVFGKILFIIYILFVVYFLCFAEWYGRNEVASVYRYNLEPFKEIKRFIRYRETLGYAVVFANLAGNVLIFLPYGFLVSMASSKNRMWRAFKGSLLLSLSVETFQLFTRVGSFDVDDMILNTFGGILGGIVFSICNTIRRHI